MEGKVTKVGRKLVTVVLKYGSTKFRLDEELKGGYLESGEKSFNNYLMYESKQAILYIIEYDALKDKISNVFSHYSNIKLSLDKLRRIHTIIQE